MIDLKKFCLMANTWLDEPFNYNGHTYASDGHMIIKVPLRADITKNKPEQIRVGEIAFSATDDGFHPIPEYEQPEKEKCSSCRGTKFSSKCDECDSDGWVLTSNDFHEYENDCKSCRGNGVLPGGKEPCQNCDGTGQTYVEAYPFVDIGEARVSIVLLEKIKDLPNVVIGQLGGKNNDMMPFRFDGGDGVLMTMQK